MNQQYDPFGRPTNGAVPPNNGQTPPGQSPYNNYNNPGGYPPPGTGYQPPYGTYGQDPRQAAYFQRENRRRLALRSQKQELRRFGNCIGLAILASALPFSLEMIALRNLTPLSFGTLMSLEPAVAALSGFIFLGETLLWNQWLALMTIIIASIDCTVTTQHARQQKEAL